MCSQPVLKLEQNYAQQSPQIIYRSKTFSLSTETYFACYEGYSLQNTWLVTNMATMKTTNLKETSTRLVVQSNTLAFGLYRYTFQVSIRLYNNGSLFNAVNTFIQIVPIGVTVFALQNGISSILIGSQQTFTLDPASYSIDLDGVISPTLLQFTFYCNTIDLNSSSPQISQTNKNLLAYKQNAQLPMLSNQTCFSSSCNTKYIISIG